MRHKVMKPSFTKIHEEDLTKHIFILDNRIYHVDTRKDITDQKYLQINGQAVNIRKAAFYILNARWPARGFLLPWE